MTVHIQRLSKLHDRSVFASGNPALDDWLRLRAGQSDRKDLARTYVAVADHSMVVIGYYAISSHFVEYNALPVDQSKGLPKMDIPVVLLGRLAVDQRRQGQGIGKGLLVDAMCRSVRLADEVGIRAIEVNAIDDAARRFYSAFGFVPLLDDPDHLMLQLRLVRQLYPIAKSDSGH